MPPRQIRRRVVPQKSEKYPYPSRYGSHSSMIDEEKTEELSDKNLVVLEDEHGYYITSRKKLDSGFADPKRYEFSRLSFYKN
tara:strand:+ start:1020 stop:1265 length:246 start_codon:yes stop_codon:yes gene_type:complete